MPKSENDDTQLPGVNFQLLSGVGRNFMEHDARINFWRARMAARLSKS